MLIGNKCDLQDNRTVTFETAKASFVFLSNSNIDWLLTVNPEICWSVGLNFFGDLSERLN